MIITMTNLYKAAFVVLVAALWNSHSAASEPSANPERIRQAIELSIPNLQRGATGSADQRECFTCHHQSVPIFAMAAAQKRGFEVDKQVLDRQVRHTYDHLKRGVEGYLKGQGQGGGVLTAGYALWALDEMEWKSDEVTSAVAHYLKDEQRELPFWRHQGRRPPSSGSDFTATYVALRALSHFSTPEQKESAAGRLAEVTKWLEETKPVDTEDHVFRLLCMRYLDEGSELREAAIAQLVSLQCADGGWAQMDTMESDAYATATAMYALQQESNIPANDPTLERGLNWLLDSQLPDGTWHVTSRAEPFQTYFETGFPHGKDQFISMAASAWATVVLASTLPEKTSSPSLTSDDSQVRLIARSNIASTGQLQPEMIPFNDIMQEFFSKKKVPGAAVAVTDQGRLVFARGYGMADTELGVPVKPLSLFRIASLSKPITAVAILQLVEQGRIGLDDKVLSILDLELEIRSAGEQFDTRMRDVTIRHLLEQRGGWDSSQSFDPMFQSVRLAKQLNIDSPPGSSDIIHAMLSHNLDFTPGERFAYSNFGYCLLGRVIEKVTEQNYEAFVKESVLAPLDIHQMRLGHSRLEARAIGEVRYYEAGKGKSVFQADLDQDVPEPYGPFNLESMDAHGGWLASAVDIARFASALDDAEHCPIVRPETISLMHARPEGLAGHNNDGTNKPVYYSLGWQIRVLDSGGLNCWHTGSLPGTTTIAIRRSDGRNLIALLNTRLSPIKDLQAVLDQVLHRAANSVTDWPTVDYFASITKEDE